MPARKITTMSDFTTMKVWEYTLKEEEEIYYYKNKTLPEKFHSLKNANIEVDMDSIFYKNNIKSCCTVKIRTFDESYDIMLNLLDIEPLSLVSKTRVFTHDE
jgi:hypothetical protein